MKKFAIIMLRDAKVRAFDYKDEWEAAIQTFVNRNVPFIPLKWHQGAEQYIQPEMSGPSPRPPSLGNSAFDQFFKS